MVGNESRLKPTETDHFHSLFYMDPCRERARTARFLIRSAGFVTPVGVSQTQPVIDLREERTILDGRGQDHRLWGVLVPGLTPGEEIPGRAAGPLSLG